MPPLALLVCCQLLALPPSLLLVRWAGSKRRRSPGFLLGMSFGSTVSVLALFALLSPWLPPAGMALESDGESPAPVLETANSLSTPPPPISEEPASESQRNRLRGLRHGYTLAKEPGHRYAAVPSTPALRVMASMHSKGEGPGFSEGFTAGYIAGLTGQLPTRE